MNYFCPQCNTMANVGDKFCFECGAKLVSPMIQENPGSTNNTQAAYNSAPTADYYNQQQRYYYQQPVVDVNDYTETFTASDIKNGKAYALMAYLLGLVGIAVAMASQYGFAKFHAKQALNIKLLAYIAIFAMFMFSKSQLVIVLSVVTLIVIFIVRILMMIKVIRGRAKFAPIIGKMRIFK